MTLLEQLFSTIEGQKEQYYTLLNQMRSGVILATNTEPRKLLFSNWAAK
jgi:hypothetical protein